MSIFKKNDKDSAREEAKEQERLELEQALKGLREITMDDLENISGGSVWDYHDTHES